jgi:hypothetical protein
MLAINAMTGIKLTTLAIRRGTAARVGRPTDVEEPMELPLPQNSLRP